MRTMEKLDYEHALCTLYYGKSGDTYYDGAKDDILKLIYQFEHLKKHNKQLKRLEKSQRTEKEILKDFKKLKWRIYRNDNQMLWLLYYKTNSIVQDKEIKIDKRNKSYKTYDYISMEEHKLLNELFQIWQWV